MKFKEPFFPIKTSRKILLGSNLWRLQVKYMASFIVFLRACLNHRLLNWKELNYTRKLCVFLQFNPFFFGVHYSYSKVFLAGAVLRCIVHIKASCIYLHLYPLVWSIFFSCHFKCFIKGIWIPPNWILIYGNVPLYMRKQTLDFLEEK